MRDYFNCLTQTEPCSCGSIKQLSEIIVKRLDPCLGAYIAPDREFAVHGIIVIPNNYMKEFRYSSVLMREDEYLKRKFFIDKVFNKRMPVSNFILRDEYPFVVKRLLAQISSWERGFDFLKRAVQKDTNKLPIFELNYDWAFSKNQRSIYFSMNKYYNSFSLIHELFHSMDPICLDWSKDEEYKRNSSLSMWWKRSELKAVTVTNLFRAQVLSVLRRSYLKINNKGVPPVYDIPFPKNFKEIAVKLIQDPNSDISELESYYSNFDISKTTLNIRKKMNIKGFITSSFAACAGSVVADKNTGKTVYLKLSGDNFYMSNRMCDGHKVQCKYSFDSIPGEYTGHTTATFAAMNGPFIYGAYESDKFSGCGFPDGIPAGLDSYSLTAIDVSGLTDPEGCNVSRSVLKEQINTLASAGTLSKVIDTFNTWEHLSETVWGVLTG